MGENGKETPSETGPEVSAGRRLEPLIRLRNLSKVYRGGGGNVHAVDALSVDIHSGITVLTGPSGCGKSTLINLIGALDEPSSGEILVGGRDVHRMSDEELDRYRRETVGVVFQFFHLIDVLTVVENVALPAELAGKPGVVARQRAAELLDRVGLGSRLHHRPHELSGGETQRCAIARALINRPLIVLADEPTGNLDSAASDRVLELFTQITADEGASALVATHDREVLRFADEELMLRDGRLADA